MIMPTSTVHIQRVDSTLTAKPGCVRHLVTATTWEQFVTLNALRASLCERARAIGAAVVITWKDGRKRTRDIVDVTLETQP
jgi:hypothetical protein